MIYCNGLPKTGTHLLMSHLDKMGLERVSDKTVKGYGSTIRNLPKGRNNGYAHAHVAAHHGLPGTVFTIFRHPRDTLISCARYRDMPAIELLHKYYSGYPFVEIYRKFLPWMEKSDAVFWFEDMQKTNDSLTYSGNLTNWREWWDGELESEYIAHGGLKLEKRLGYENTSL